ncbi:potassium channel family protein [Pelagicoccus mobilis]|uniref:Potassium channel domain-containing protein n=1 Tax=Pelagicoccus mobilis TaxID=415221 RepID=A0A934S1Z2_9BACT|nr:potassium channel family protein [Pelagicoccus mobilis]MBK1877608.1 hypothetical protein [Pelagicoccus mobilis]
MNNVPRNHLEAIFGGLSEKRFRVLFLILCFLFFCMPVLAETGLMDDPWVAKLLYVVVYMSLLASASSIASHNRRSYLTMVTVSVLAIGLNVAYLVWPSEVFMLLNHAVLSLVLLYVIVSLSHYMFSCRRVTMYTIYASLSAFLMIALLWSMIYGIIDMVDPEAFNVPAHLAGEGRLSSLGSIRAFQGLYFSLVTITTLGYGDISPISVSARMLCSAEAFVGQMFMAVMVARLVGVYSTQSLERDVDGGDRD